MGNSLSRKREVSILTFGVMILMIVAIAFAPLILDMVATRGYANEGTTIYYPNNTFLFTSKLYFSFLGTTILGVGYLAVKEIKTRLNRK